jgi:hypothetical protein
MTTQQDVANIVNLLSEIGETSKIYRESWPWVDVPLHPYYESKNLSLHLPSISETVEPCLMNVEFRAPITRALAEFGDPSELSSIGVSSFW